MHDEPVEGETGPLPNDRWSSPESGLSVVRVFNGDQNKVPVIPTLIPSAIPTSIRRSLCGNGKLDYDEECDCGTRYVCIMRHEI